jgi:hypothetical protein
MNQSSFDRCRIDNVDLHTDLMMLYNLAELAPLPGEPQTVQHPCIEHSLQSDRRPVPGSSCAVRAFRPAVQPARGMLKLTDQGACKLVRLSPLNYQLA